MYNSTKLSQVSCLLTGHYANSFDLSVTVHVFFIQALVQLGKERRARLEDSLRLYKFFGDMEEEEMFVKETEKVLSSKDVGNDLISLTRLQQKHKVSDACRDLGKTVKEAQSSYFRRVQNYRLWRKPENITLLK